MIVRKGENSHKQQVNRMGYQPINFQQKFGLFSEQWQPKVVAEMNDYQFKVVQLQGDFIWQRYLDLSADRAVAASRNWIWHL